MENLTAADVAAVARPYGGYGYGNDGFGFGGSGLWLFAILALMWGGASPFGRNAIDGRVATVEDLANQSNFTRLEGQVRANENLIQQGITNLGNGLCTLGYEMATKFGDTDKQIAECCCGINRNIDAVRYENALNTASINANTTASIQKVLDRICQDKTESMQNRITLLEMQNLVQPPRAIPAYTVCNPYTGTYAGYTGCGYSCGNPSI